MIIFSRWRSPYLDPSLTELQLRAFASPTELNYQHWLQPLVSMPRLTGFAGPLFSLRSLGRSAQGKLRSAKFDRR